MMWTKENMPGQSGKTVIVTGANAGIGFETALAFFEKGAHVVMACRDLKKAEEAIASIQQQGGAGSLEAATLNLADLVSVKQFAEQFIRTHQHLHILVNNAGVMIPPASKTSDGFELQFGVNFIGHFALTGRLYPLLNTTPGARVVTVSSMAYVHGTIDFDNLRSERDYDAMREYCQSKLADIMLALELHRRIKAKNGGVLSIAAQPGANKTELSRHMSESDYGAAVARIGALMDPWQGALPSLYAATADDVKGGDFYSPDADGGYRGYPARLELLPHALDENVANKLWDLAERTTGMVFP
jgi:NAD(P)-dependent dehydrogenase (short-subunit alcohol dehydrogenase family)